jgi:hypothetical protein
MCVEYKVYSGGNATGETVTSGWALTNANVDFTVKMGGRVRAFRSWRDMYQHLAGWGVDSLGVPPLTVCIVPRWGLPRSFISHRSQGSSSGALLPRYAPRR